MRTGSNVGHATDGPGSALGRSRVGGNRMRACHKRLTATASSGSRMQKRSRKRWPRALVVVSQLSVTRRTFVFSRN
ncbi:hypothetical protein BHM03_00002055 [Ensete ventricosum]|nr:hypothetical protein BHM03_00002055 [Ensete ventricosum]